MTVNSCKLLLLVACLASPFYLLGQTDSVAFDQARLRIWCETARFVYDDNNADSLLASINCQSWESLQQSVKETDASLGVTRLMNSVDKPAIYRGFSTNEARLQKLVAEISNRLKQSSVRRNNSARLGRVDSLTQQLKLLVRHAGTPVDNQYTEPTAATTAEESYTEELPTGPLETQEETITTTTMPWNELLQWLALLLLGGFLVWRLTDLDKRYSRLKHDFRALEKQVNNFMIHAPLSGSAHLTGDTLTETEVRNVVKEELRQAEPTSKEEPVVGKAAVPLSAPSVVEEHPAAEAQTQAAPKQALTTTPDFQAGSSLFYDKMPFKGGFHQNEMSRERQRDSLYTIKLVPERPGEAEYWITEDVEVQRYAMQNGLSFFEEGCEFVEVEENPVRVVNEETGWLQKEGSVWKIVEKAKVRFE